MIVAKSSMSSMLRSSSSSMRRLISSTTAHRRSLSSFVISSVVAPRRLPPTIAVMMINQPRHLSSPRHFHTSPPTHQESNASPEKQEMSSGEADIHSLLSKRFNPTHLQVQDVSGGCGSFYAIVVASKEFQGLGTVKQHRLVNECLKDIIGGIHGLQLKTIASE